MNNASNNIIVFKNLKGNLILMMLAMTGKTFAEYKANPFFDKDITISGAEIMNTYTYRTANDILKNEIEMLAISSVAKRQVTNEKTLSLALQGINNFYRNDIEREQRGV